MIRRRALPFGGALLVLLAAASCGVDPVVFSSGTGGAASGTSAGGDTGADLCAPGAICPGDGVTCCGGHTVASCEAGKVPSLGACGEGESCDNDQAKCLCNVGARRCSSTQEAQICEDEKGVPGWTTVKCSGFCSGGQCVDLDFCPVPDVLSCSSDGAFVLRCTDAHQHAEVFNCKSNGYEKGCIPLKNGAVPSKPEDLCVNGCGVRNVPLAMSPCAAVAGSVCSVYACDATGELVPDHKECRVQGQPCSADEECATCSCESGSCKGLGKKHCPIASQCP